MRAWVLHVLAAVSAVILAGCATVYNLPGNSPLGEGVTSNVFGREVRGQEDDLLLALSFSGGGMRAAAFSFGVMTELDRSRVGSNQAKSLLDRVDFVSGVSGGSVTAAYFGLKKRAALDDFRERFLLRNAEEGLNTQVTSAISAALSAAASTTASSPVGSIKTCSMARGSTPLAKTAIRGSGSTPPTSTTARHSCSERPPSTRCAATSAPIESPKRCRLRQRCRLRLHRSCWRPFPAAARRSCPTGSSAPAAIRTRNPCCGLSPKLMRAITMARCDS